MKFFNNKILIKKADLETPKIIGNHEYGNYDENYNTILKPHEEIQFKEWRSALPKQLQYDKDYDLKGAFKQGLVNPEKAIKPDKDAHLLDTFKKPNHKTFSTGSVYHNEKTPGGEWTQIPNTDNWTYKPSDWQLSQPGYHKELTQNYWPNYEGNRGNKLIAPEYTETES